MHTILKLRTFVPENDASIIFTKNRSRSKRLLGLQPVLLFFLLLSVWFPMHGWLRQIDPTAAVTDESIWLQIILSLLAFLIIVALCAWLLNLFWQMANLPSSATMVSQFKSLTSWQQLVFYFASYALLLLAATVCLVAIC